MFHLLDAIVTVVCLSLSYVAYRQHRESHVYLSQGYILVNQVTHARLLPIMTSHSFTYPTLSLLLSLNALENHSLDLARGLLFGYGGIWGRVTGLRSAPYLSQSFEAHPRTIKEKLVQLLKHRGFMHEGDILEDAWIMTMPSFLGYEGINPLTVYFCYKPRGKFWLTVLEIHNTFGESHVHILEVGSREDPEPPRGFHHQWTFPREFHVSPFNDRSGFYVVSVKKPTHPPTFPHVGTNSSLPAPLPAVRVHLHILSPSTSTPTPGPLKLTALLRPTSASPLTIPAVFFALARFPFALFLSSPRILYQAWVLHYKKRLDVYTRPEPHPAVTEWVTETDPGITVGGETLGGGVKWQKENFLEKYARTRIETFLKSRVEQTRISVTLIPANPSSPCKVFSPSHPSIEKASDDDVPRLTIHYLSPRLFTILFLSPSAQHALLLGSTTERLFFASSRELFLSIFTLSPGCTHDSRKPSLAQRIRIHGIPSPDLTSPNFPMPHTHPLDNICPTVIGSLITVIVIWALLALERFEACMFAAFHARVVPGKEPWKQWERASIVYLNRRGSPNNVNGGENTMQMGSVYREEP